MTLLHGGTKRYAKASVERGQWVLVAGATVILLAVAVPVIAFASPLADDYHFCLRARNGYAPYIRSMIADTGVVRPARFVELFVISGLCGRVPFGAIILIPLSLKVAVAGLLWGLLRDMRLPSPWPAVGAALWVLEPLGTEAALWPSAMHVNLGLAFAVGALRLFFRRRHGLGAAAAIAACLCIEQVIFALPLAAWLVVPREHRRQAAAAAVAACAAVLASYVLWPGTNPRQDIPPGQRVANVFADPLWYVRFPAIGLGLHSGFLAFFWALPWSILCIGATIGAGSRFAPKLLAGAPVDLPSRRRVWAAVVQAVVLIGLINLPLIVTEVGHSARTFTPTWLALVIIGTVAATRLAAVPHRVMGVLLGAFVGFAALSLAFSAWVRVQTVTFDKAALAWIAERTSDGDVVAVCNVSRTVVEPAPAGSFHLHEFFSEYNGPLEYHTGRIAELRTYWRAPCPDPTDADLVVEFDDLRALVQRR